MGIRLRAAVLGLALAAGCRHTPPAAISPAARPIQHVILLSVDGLMPDSYVHPDAHGLRIPTLRAMVVTGRPGYFLGTAPIAPGASSS